MKFEPILVTTIEEVMNNVDNNATKAAALIGVSRSTMLRYIDEPDSVMLKMVDKFPNYQFVIAGAPSQPFEFYKQFIQRQNVKFVSNKTYDLLSVSYAALVTSGTATLEASLFKIPEIVCYKTSWLSYQIGKRLINLKFISLVNLIMNREVVKELVQNDFNEIKLEQELHKILDGYNRAVLFLDYYDLEQKLGGKGASKKVADVITRKKQLSE